MITLHTLNAPALNKFNYAKGDYELMNQYLSQVDWHNLLISHCVEENWLIFKETLNTATNQFIPTTLFKPKNSNSPWWSKSLVKEVMKKHYLFSKYKATKSSSDYTKYTQQRNLVRSKVRKAQIDYEENLIAKLHSNPKTFYSYVKSKQKVRHHIPYLQHSNGQLAGSDKENGQILASFFESTFSTEDTSSIPEFTQRSDNMLTSIDISVEVVFSKLSRLKSYKSPGPDNIRSYIRI